MGRVWALGITRVSGRGSVRSCLWRRVVSVNHCVKEVSACARLRSYELCS